MRGAAAVVAAPGRRGGGGSLERRLRDAEVAGEVHLAELALADLATGHLEAAVDEVAAGDEWGSHTSRLRDPVAGGPGGEGKVRSALICSWTKTRLQSYKLENTYSSRR